ncbi:MAG: DUF6378 domain-containing protein [Campylobacter sp.]|nr:DUF6378 domain-containing protein [Campylobacter sp.]
MEINNVLEQRKQTHGDFEKVAKLDTELFVTFNAYFCSDLSNEQYCAIKMILHKIARIGCGNAQFIDHWQDIIGYATLVLNELEQRNAIPTPNI